MQEKVWSTYCRLYGEFGTGEFGVPEALSRIRISEPMCRKVVWTLRKEGFLERVGREGRRVKFRAVPPTEAALRMALRDPFVRYREVLRFFESIRGPDWYLVGTTALNYYLPCFAPVLELGGREPAKLKEIAPPYLRLVVSKDVPRSYETIEFEGTVFRVASVEDAIVQSYRNFPATLIDSVEIDYMAAVAMKIRGERLDTDRFEELPAPAREHVREVMAKLSYDPMDELGEMAELFLSASPQGRIEGLLDKLGDAVRP
jgi:hypothetical protein